MFQNVLSQVAEQFTRWDACHVLSHMAHNEGVQCDSCDLYFRAFRINELKTEVTNRLAMLEKRVEREWCYEMSNASSADAGS